MPAERLTLELTEHAVVENLDQAAGVLGALRQLGVGLSLDDFGTGYSSLLYLRDLPLTEVKIDRSFMSRVPHSVEDLAIINSVASLGRTIGLRVVAEGVESPDQARAAVAVGCHAAQGFLWGPPVAVDDLDCEPRVEVPSRPQPPVMPLQPASDSRVAPRVHELFGDGASLHTIAAAFNRDGLRTAKGTRWTARSVALDISGLPNA